MSNVEHVVETFEKYAGQEEVGPNECGPFPNRALAAVGLPEGNPWCAATIALVMDEAGVRGWPRTGDTWALQAWAREHHCYFQPSPNLSPKRGDVIELIGRDGQPFHVGMVTANNGDGTVSTIEGNSYSADDVNETGRKGVHRHVRPIDIGKYIRWEPVLDQDAQPEDLQ